MNWRAKWIWLPGTELAKHTTLQARRELKLARAPQSAVLSISASQIYRLSINGQFVGRGPDRADPRFPYFDQYDVVPFLRRGNNVILCLIYHVAAQGANRAWCLYGGPGGFLAQFDVDGVTLPTRAGWKMRPAPGWIAHEELISRFTGF